MKSGLEHSNIVRQHNTGIHSGDACRLAWVLFDEAITVVTLLGVVLTAIGVSLMVKPANP